MVMSFSNRILDLTTSHHSLNDMHIEILGTESMGVRGLSCLVELEDRKIIIDPGLALGYRRRGLLPHPAQVAVGEVVRSKILAALGEATDIVMSHYHGDHVPLPDANPYQLSVKQLGSLDPCIHLWTKGEAGLSRSMVRRRASIAKALGRVLPNAEGQSDGMLAFSRSVPHGVPSSRLGTVMMTCIQGPETVFVHASDVQLLDDQSISLILDWQPDIVLVAGPPIYLPHIAKRESENAWTNAVQLASHIDTLILDHHLLRCEEGLVWLDRLSEQSNHRVLCAADFMEHPRCLLEAQRLDLYEEMPVPDSWHEDYACGHSNTRNYQGYRKRCMKSCR
jgi:predicted metallo-beta-lactamase superfamily hydrolase